MKKCMVIGDIHGRVCWKDFGDIKFLLYAEPEAAGYGGFVPEFFKYIFVGDYVDSFTETNKTIKENLLEIIRFKKLYPEHVILLWGNHDVNYIQNVPWQPVKYHVSGFRPEAHYDLYDIFNENKDLFQVAYQYNNNIFTHAGVHYGWYHFVFTKAIKDMGWDDLNVAEQINNAYLHNIECIFDVDWYRGGNKRVGGPLWCSKELLYNKPLKNCHQYVGHTAIKDGQIQVRKINESTTVTFCDILNEKKAFYTTFI